MASIIIKYLPEGIKVLCSLIAPIIKEGNCYNACKFVVTHCENEISKIQGIDFDQSYSPVAHADSLIINIAMVDMHRLTDIILDVINALHNTNFPIHERVCVSPPHYYLDWFEKSYPNIPLNQCEGPFFFNAWIEFREQKHPDDNGTKSLIQRYND